MYIWRPLCCKKYFTICCIWRTLNLKLNKPEAEHRPIGVQRFSWFLPSRPTGPIRSSCCDVRVSVCCPLPMWFLGLDRGGASLARGLVWSVPRPCVEPYKRGGIPNWTRPLPPPPSLFVLLFSAQKKPWEATTAATTTAGKWGGKQNWLAKEMLFSPFVSQRKQKYWCYYPHRSWDSVSPLCMIFII